MQDKGKISIHTENIFPIIKKYLYSDHEIFLRELVSNAIDATQKIKQMASLGEYNEKLEDTTIDISINSKTKTITISDKGIGMTAEEIKKFINQIAFSGATEFLEKYKDKSENQQIIGHFGLGFYSAFMVAKKVDIVSLSYQAGAEPVLWSCSGDTDFEILPAKKKQRGTDVILHIADDSVEFLEEARINSILNKHSRFLPVPIRFGKKDKSVEDGKDKEGKPKYKTIQEDNIINNTVPIWVQAPTKLKEEDYIKFYKDLYPFSENPLFWIHLNVDYPFHITGVLYFPKLNTNFELQKNKIHLYSKQVFITDEVKDVVPEFLQLLHGVIDSPDIPLNVSRSYLQSDANVKKINGYITKKVADKLGNLFKEDRKSFEEKWKDVGMFIKYGVIAEEKFAEQAKDFLLLKNIDGKYFTLEEYKKHIQDNQTNKDKKLVILYTSDPDKQHGYIETAKKRSYDVLDNHFINYLEQKQENMEIKRVDAEIIDKLVDKGGENESVLTDEEQEIVKKTFEKIVNDKQSTVSLTPMATDDLPTTVTLPEFFRRMKDMQGTGGGPMMFGDMPLNLNININTNHTLIKKIAETKDNKVQEKLANQAFDLAMLSQGLLKGKKLTDFVQRSIMMTTS